MYRVHKIEEGHYELAASMESISKDMHIFSATLVELKDVMKSMANIEVEFQLFKQKTDQNIDTLWRRFDELKVLDKEVVAKLDTEISKKIEDEVGILTESINKNFRYTLWMVGTMLSLFLAYVAYMDVKFSALGDNLTKVEQASNNTSTKLDTISVQSRDLYFDVKELRKNQQDTLQAIVNK